MATTGGRSGSGRGRGGVVVVVGDVDGIFTSDSDDRGQTDDSGDGGEEGADKGGYGSVKSKRRPASERATDDRTDDRHKMDIHSKLAYGK
jgi:hypothetical protein